MVIVIIAELRIYSRISIMERQELPTTAMFSSLAFSAACPPAPLALKLSLKLTGLHLEALQDRYGFPGIASLGDRGLDAGSRDVVVSRSP